MAAFLLMFSKDSNSSPLKKGKGQMFQQSARPFPKLCLRVRCVQPIKFQPLALRVVKAPVPPSLSELTMLLSCAYPAEGGPASVHFRNLRQIVSDNINSMDGNLDGLSAALKDMEADRFYGTLDPFACAYYGDPIAIHDFHDLIDGVGGDVTKLKESATIVAMSRDIGGMCMSSNVLDCSIRMCLSEALIKIKEAETLVNRFLAPFNSSGQCYYDFLDYFDKLVIVIERETTFLESTLLS